MPNFIKLDLSGPAEEALKRHLRLRIMAIEDGLHPLHEDKVTKWRKGYEATPREAIREFPYYNAYNLVVPIIAIFSDTLLARVMAAIFKTRPLYTSKIFGEHPDLTDDTRSVLEDFMEYVGLEPDELGLYEVYHDWLGDTIKYGTSVVKAPHEVRYRYDIVPAGDGTGEYEKINFVKEIDYEGPRPAKIPFECFGIPAGAKSLQSADILYHKRVMTREELMERRFFQIYEPSRVDSILTRPDRSGPSSTEREKQESSGNVASGAYGYAEWDVYECWLPWKDPTGQYRPRIIGTYHKTSDTLLRGIYDTHKLLPYSLTRLFYRDDSIYGYGFCETMWHFQEEISEQHNGRLDNRTVANTRVWRVSPDSKLHSGYRIFPGATLPAEEGEIEGLPAGDISNQTLEDEQFSLELAERRAGVSAAKQGMGAGGMSKRGVYNAMGTLALIQEGNDRTDLNISDCRYGHTRLGRILLSDYANFGLSKRLKNIFEGKEEELQKALDAVKAGTIGIPIQSSTASINREVEKQNDVIVTNLITRHYQMVAALIAQVNNQMAPPALRKYLEDVIEASNRVMRGVLRHFDIGDADLLVPDVDKPPAQGGGQGQPPAQGSPQAAGGSNGSNGQTPSNSRTLPFLVGGPGGQGVS